MDNVKFYNWNKIFGKAGKEILGNLKKGVQIGVLGTALTAGTMLGVGCSQPSGGNTVDDDQIIENPNEKPNDKDKDKTEYAEPTNRAIGNGNYNLYSFLGDGFISASTVVEETNHYLSKGETHIKGSINSFSEFLKGRPNAQNYFSSYISNMKNNSYFHIDEWNPQGHNIDLANNTITDTTSPIFVNIIENLSTNNDRTAFIIGYNYLSNEAFKEGLGGYRNYESGLMKNYTEAKEVFANRWQNHNDLKSIDMNDYKQVTNKIDQLLEQAAGNMNNQVTAADLRQVYNMAMTTQSLHALHDYTKSSLKHNACAMDMNLTQKMEDKATEMFYAELQQQDQGMAY